METILGFFLIVAITGIGMWLRKRYLKRVMEKGLGRRVEDEDLTSISKWMEASTDEHPQNRPRKPFG